MSRKVDFLDQLCDYLAQHGFGEINEHNGTVNIFAGVYPAQPDNCIAILGNLGGTPSIDVVEFEFPRFQVIVRNTDYYTAAQVIRDVRTVLHDQLAVALPNFYCLRIQAEQEGQSIGQDQNGLFEFSINFVAQIRYADSLSG